MRNPNPAGYKTERRISPEKGDRTPVRKMHQAEYYLNLLKLFEIEPREYPRQTAHWRPSSIVIHPGASKREGLSWIDLHGGMPWQSRKRGGFVSGEVLPDIGYLRRCSHRCMNLLRFCDSVSCLSATIPTTPPGARMELRLRCLWTGGSPVTGPRRFRRRGNRSSLPCLPPAAILRGMQSAISGKPMCIETITG